MSRFKIMAAKWNAALFLIAVITLTISLMATITTNEAFLQICDSTQKDTF